MKLKLKKEIKQKIVNVLLNITIIFLGIILLITIYNFFQTKVLGNNYSNFFGITILEVKTGSMEPTISPGDWIIVKKQNSYEFDDIISFVSEEEVITHRINSVIGDDITTKGDANNGQDKDAIKKDQVIGEVINIWPSFGIIKNTLLNPVVIIFLLITFYIFLVILKGEEKIMIEKAKKIFKNIFKKSNEDKILESFGDDFIDSNKIDEKNKNINSYTEKIEDYSDLKFDENENEDDLETEELEEDESVEDEIENKEKNEQEEKIRQEAIDEELSKTTFFRIISVEENENDIETFNLNEEDFEDLKEVVKEEPEETQEEKITLEDQLDKEDETVKEEKEKTVEEIVEEKIALEKIFDKPENKKCKGIISKIIAIKESEIGKIIEEITKEDKIKNNELSVRKLLIKSYIESRYYNIFSKSVAMLERKTSTAKYKYVLDNNTDIINEKNGFTKKIKERAKKTLIRIGNALEEDSLIISKNYTGNDKQYDEKLKKYAMMMMMISKLEYFEKTSKDLKGKKNLYARELIKYTSEFDIEIESIDQICKNIINIQKEHTRIIKFFNNKLKTEMFEILYSELKTNKNKYIVNLKHNINFSQVYSDEIINKAYQEGIVAEDKLNVLMTLLQSRLSKDMIEGDFINEYIVPIPNTLCDKEKKLERIFKTNDDEYIKKNVIFLITYDEFMQHAKLIKELRKKGYRISCYIEETTKFTSKNKISIGISEYIFIDKKIKNLVIDNIINDNFKDKIIRDEIDKKIKSLGGSK